MAAAPIVLTNALVSVNGTDLSTWVRSVKISYAAETPDTTAMGSSTKTRLPGLKDWSMDIEFNQDWAASAVDVTLFSLVGANAFTIYVAPVNATITSTNPKYTGSALLSDYPAIGNKVGDVATVTAKFTGTGTLSRATS